MDIQLMMNNKDMIKTRLEVESFNKSLNKNGRKVKNSLGKDDFLRLLIVQLENQDPTKPLEDKEFIAQMAQFSSLEQMTGINKTLSNLILNHKENLSYSLLGKYVEVFDQTTGKMDSGIVKEISFRTDVPTITFNGLSYSVDDIAKVALDEKELK